LQTFFIVVGIAVVIGLVLLGQYQASKRKAELCNWAKMRGLTFRETSDSSMDNRYPFFSCLAQGDNRYADNIIDGRAREHSICAFDYHYETYSTDSKGHRQTHHHAFSAVILTADVPMQPLSIRNETLFDKIGAFFGHEDINFESAEFSRVFCVKSPDRRWAFDVLNQHSMEFLLASPRFILELNSRFVIAYRDSVFSASDYDAALNVIVGLLDRIPKTVFDELKGAN